MTTNDDLLVHAHDDDERVFARDALAFLTANVARRTHESVQWGVGEEKLALFHETSGDQVGCGLRLDQWTPGARRPRHADLVRALVPPARGGVRRG
jgi:hypothetical protein